MQFKDYYRNVGAAHFKSFPRISLNVQASSVKELRLRRSKEAYQTAFEISKQTKQDYRVLSHRSA
jgi:hypothetical protein